MTEKRKRQYRHISEEEVELIRKHYADMTNMEFMQAFGMSFRRIAYIKGKLGLKKSPTTLERGRSLTRTAEANRKRSEKMRRHMNVDRWRIKAGLPQKTRLRIRRLSTKQRGVKTRLISRYNYFETEGDPFLLCYDSDTRRLTGKFTEEYYTNKYRLRFEPADE